ncbi:hypothetical protein AB8S16_28370, partial [Klebsiella pneumoniae]
TYDLFVGKTLLHGDVLMWLMKTLLTSRCINQRGAGQELRVKSTPPVEAMIARRRERYPEDVYLFQSHSNRVKYHRRPVTIIAFNAALRRAARSLPDVNVSSSSARNIPD